MNGIHLIALLNAPDLVDDDIPEQLRSDWRGLVAEWKEMQKEARDLTAMKVERAVRIRHGKPDPYPELDELESEPIGAEP